MRALLFILLLLASGCQSKPEPDPPPLLLGSLEEWAGIPGKPEYLNAPYVCAGDRLYIVGHQDGSFPDLGWHIPGEMGGIWQHPIKLMDAYRIRQTQDWELRFYPPAGTRNVEIDGREEKFSTGFVSLKGTDHTVVFKY